MTFIDDDFLLSSEAARKLYHNHAADQPIYDYHCHLPPQDLVENRCFANLTEIWLDGDHYKWRAMRANGVDEAYITGEADPYDKFLAWARSVPFTLRNPLYHWTHLELKRYFGIDSLLNGDTAKDIWDETERQLKEMPVSTILDRFNVALICTTDDPADDLAPHKTIGAQDLFSDTAVYPAFRPDHVYKSTEPVAWFTYIDQIQQASGTTCDSLEGLLEALKLRHQFFHDAGGRLSDHGLTHLPVVDCSVTEASKLFDQLRRGQSIDQNSADRFLVFMMLHLAGLDAERGWVRQLHLGAMRHNNPRAIERIGPDSGYDSIGDYPQAEGLSRYMGTLAERGHLPKTILYNLNPSDNYLFAAMIGNFQGGRAGQACEPGRIQLGSGWWFLDQEEAMRWQLNALSNLGLLSRFVGMLTDSRSFMSYPRHEYFRRILCDLLGADIKTGRLPDDDNLVGGLVEDICFNNAKRYFGMRLKGKYEDGALLKG